MKIPATGAGIRNKWDGDVVVREHRYASQADQPCIDF